MAANESQKNIQRSRRHSCRVPRQQRSRSTVKSIKQAALLLLNEEGINGCGTERIAKRAGVNIGSLYQYFPNRDAILASLYEDVSVEFGAALQSRLPKLLTMPTAQAVERTVSLLIAMHDRNRLVLLQLVNEMPKLGLAEQPTSLMHMTQNVTRSYLANRILGLQPRQLDRMVFFLQQIILGCIMAYVRGAYPRITRREFIRDLARIVSGYIDGWESDARDAAPPAKPKGSNAAS